MLAGARRSVLELAPPRPGLLVVDVGCGPGALLGTYAAAGCRVAGVDRSPAMLSEARRRAGPGALLAQGDGTALPFASGSAGVVTAMMLLHTLSLESGRAVLAEMARVAGPGGVVVVADHSAGSEASPGFWAARWAGRAIEAVAGHGPGVRRLLAGGGAASLAAGAGLQVEARRVAGGGVLEVLCLRSAGSGA